MSKAAKGLTVGILLVKVTARHVLECEWIQKVQCGILLSFLLLFKFSLYYMSLPFTQYCKSMNVDW